MIEKTASVHWQGPGKKGHTTLQPRGLAGRSSMNKAQLEAALRR